MNPTQFADTDNDPLALANAVDFLCDAFEESWKRGKEPKIEDFLQQTEGAARTTLFVELVKVDLHYRSLRGETPVLQQYATRFPQYVDALSHVYDDTTLDLALTRSWRPAEAKQQIGNYELISLIGHGGFGNVWTAWHSTLERKVAVKLPKSKLTGPVQIQLFLHEARAAAKLAHPNIVAVHDFGEAEQGGYIVFELIQGINLKKWLLLRRPDSQQAASLAAKLADALDHAHSHGVVHRDLKPANVLMDGSDEPHISDFGIAKRMDLESTIASGAEVLGTVPYMSTEQVIGDNKAVDAQSDIYSLGIILYEMLTGRVPFQGDQESIIYQVINDPPRPPRELNNNIDRDLETICLKCLAKAKRDRYATAGELRDDLQRYLRKEPILARRIGIPGRMWRWVRRNPLMASVAGGGVAAALSTAGLMAYALSMPPLPEPPERLVTLTTEPADAQVAFVPLDELTSEPLPKQIIHCEGRSPVEQALLPGNYLVIAYFDDGSNRFHEVFRRVPLRKEEGLHGGFNHLRWQVLGDGRIELPRIEIPHTGQPDPRMALVSGSGQFEMGRNGDPKIPAHLRSVPSFYMDSVEVSVADFRVALGPDSLDPDLKYVPVPDNWALTSKWNQAVLYAEKVGKRLPTEAEFELAATLGGEIEYSWERSCQTNDCGGLFEQQAGYGPVGTPSQDALPTDPPIIGLCSNVAEWTMTRVTDYYPGNEPGAQRQFRDAIAASSRVVRGGDLSVAAGSPIVSPEARDPRARWSHLETTLAPGIGFRCVRSTKPRLMPEDYDQIVSE